MASRLTITALCREVEERTGVKPNLAKHVIKALAEIAADEIGSGHEIKIPGFASVRPAYKPKQGKRMVRNPQTGEQRMGDPIPAKITVRARPDAALRRAVPTTASKPGKELAAADREKREKSAARKAEREAAAA